MPSFGQGSLNVIENICEEAVIKNASEWQINSFGMPSPSSRILEVLCSNQCSGHGKCQKGTCVCDQGKKKSLSLDRIIFQFLVLSILGMHQNPF